MRQLLLGALLPDYLVMGPLWQSPRKDPSSGGGRRGEGGGGMTPQAKAPPVEGAPSGAYASSATTDQAGALPPQTAAVLSHLKDFGKNKFYNRELKKVPTNFPKWTEMTKWEGKMVQGE